MTMPTDVEIARAQRLGSLAARSDKTLADCPYADDQRVLRSRWALAYADADPELLAGADDAEPDGPDAEDATDPLAS